MKLSGVQFKDSHTGQVSLEARVGEKGVTFPVGEDTFIAGDILENGLRIAGEELEYAVTLGQKYGISIPEKSPAVLWPRDGAKLIAALIAVYGKRGGDYQGVYPIEG
jgi:hypothetical protein